MIQGGGNEMAERWLVDESGNRITVVLPIEEYNHIVEDLEELEDIRAFDEAKASGEKPGPIEQAIAGSIRTKCSKSAGHKTRRGTLNHGRAVRGIV
jgi:hypothetical protein